MYNQDILECPAYMDEKGVERCGLPAQVKCRYVMDSSHGPLESAMIRCPSGHFFNGPIQSLTFKKQASMAQSEDRAVAASVQ